MSVNGGLVAGDQQYDVVVVGGGVTGAILSKVLAESAVRDSKSISILILEAGRGAGLTEASHQSYLDTFQRASIKTPNSPYPNTPNAPQPEDLAFLKAPSDRYFRQDGPLPFGSNNTRALGGTTLHWMGIALRMMRSDFKMKELYECGENWPIGYDDLKEYYEMAEWELGVSATRRDQLCVPGVEAADFGDYEFPMTRIPPSHLDGYLARKIGNNFEFPLGGVNYPVRFVPIPQARNSMPNSQATDPRRYIGSFRRPTPYRPYGAPEDPLTGSGQRCEGNASCIPICPARAKYTALKTMQQLMDLSRLQGVTIDVVTKAVASDLQVDDSGRVIRINYLQYESEDLPYATRRSAAGRRFVLAASAIENAKLLLASRNKQWPRGLANKSGQVGQNLMDHPFVLAWGLAQKGDQLGTFRGPGATSDLPMRDGDFRKVHAAFRTDVSNWGWGLTDDAPSRDIERMIDPDSFRQEYKGKPQNTLLNAKPLFGTNLRQEICSTVQRQVTLGFLMEQLPERQNYVTIDDGWRDQLGIHRPVIHYDISQYTLAGISAAYDLARNVFKKAGVTEFTDPENKLGTTIEYNGAKFKYIGAGHIMGTHRMGLASSDSVVDPYQRSWEHKNLYVIGCGSMPTAGTSNPTLTAVALAIRSAEKLFSELDLGHR